MLSAMAASWAGLATSGAAVEGGYNGVGQPANQWGRWELAGLVAGSGRGCDLWEHPEVLLDRLAAVGCDAVGLSVEWARIEPEDGRVDAAALDRYAAILTACADRDMAPVVSLHDRTHPGWLGEELWLTPGAPDRFAAHVDRVVERLGDRCRRWVTVHEPNAEAASGWLAGVAPPGRFGALSDAWAVCDNLLTGHLLAYDVVHRHQPDAEVTLSPRASSVYDVHQLLVDVLCARHLGVGPERLDEWLADRRAAHDRALRPDGAADAALRAVAAATSPFGVAASRLRRILRRPCPRRAVDTLYAGPHELPLDAAAVSWGQPVAARLVRLPVRRPGASSGGVRGTTAVWLRPPWEVPPPGEGLVGWCRRQADLVPGLPRWVLDDGVAVPPGGAARLDGWDLARYLAVERSALERAAAAGAPVTGYLLRSPSCAGLPSGSAEAQAFRSLAGRS